MPREKTFSDNQLKKALIETDGQPTKAAKMLGVTYATVWNRINANQKLKDVQKAYRAKTFQNVSNLALNVLLTGIMQEPEIDEEGNVMKGKFKDIVVDYRARLGLIPNMLQTFKTDEGISEELNVSAEVRGKTTIVFSKGAKGK